MSATLAQYQFVISLILAENEQLSFAKATQLPAFLENEKQLLEQEKKQLNYNRMLRDKQFTQLYEVCVEINELLIDTFIMGTVSYNRERLCLEETKLRIILLQSHKRTFILTLSVRIGESMELSILFCR